MTTEQIAEINATSQLRSEIIDLLSANMDALANWRQMSRAQWDALEAERIELRRELEATLNR